MFPEFSSYYSIKDSHARHQVKVAVAKLALSSGFQARLRFSFNFVCVLTSVYLRLKKSMSLFCKSSLKRFLNRCRLISGCILTELQELITVILVLPLKEVGKLIPCIILIFSPLWALERRCRFE